jgi:hypothetical protein
MTRADSKDLSDDDDDNNVAHSKSEKDKRFHLRLGWARPGRGTEHT